MKSLIALVKQYPVRTYGYTVVAALLGLLVALGVLAAPLLPIVLTVAAVVLAVPATEAVHNAVSPVDPGPKV